MTWRATLRRLRDLLRPSPVMCPVCGDATTSTVEEMRAAFAIVCWACCACRWRNRELI